MHFIIAGVFKYLPSRIYPFSGVLWCSFYHCSSIDTPITRGKILAVTSGRTCFYESVVFLCILIYLDSWLLKSNLVHKLIKNVFLPKGKFTELVQCTLLANIDWTQKIIKVLVVILLYFVFVIQNCKLTSWCNGQSSGLVCKGIQVRILIPYFIHFLKFYAF